MMMRRERDVEIQEEREDNVDTNEAVNDLHNHSIDFSLIFLVFGINFCIIGSVSGFVRRLLVLPSLSSSLVVSSPLTS